MTTGKLLIDRDWHGMSAITLSDIRHSGNATNPAVPWDPADFRRCYNWFIVSGGNRETLRRTLQMAAALYPMWKPFADNWDEMERLYLEETKNETEFGTAPKLYAFMQKIRWLNVFSVRGDVTATIVTNPVCLGTLTATPVDVRPMQPVIAKIFWKWKRHS